MRSVSASLVALSTSVTEQLPTKSASCLRLLDCGSMPAAISLATISLSVTAAAIDFCSRSAIAIGVLAGSQAANQAVIS